MGPEAGPDPDHLAVELRLGALQRRHGMVLPLLLGPLVAGALLFAGPWLLEDLVQLARRRVGELLPAYEEPAGWKPFRRRLTRLLY